MLYIVATPIGNLQDISFRALEVLKNVSLIACENTKHSVQLLNHYQIKNKLISYHSKSSNSKLNEIIKILKNNQDVALISDAGTPAISDPGGLLIKQAIENNIKVQMIPGATAFLMALVNSGFDITKFQFLGFIPHKKGRKTFINNLVYIDKTTVFYESKHRILKTLKQLTETLDPKQQIFVSRELTKQFEENISGTAENILNYFKDTIPKGEFVIVVNSHKKNK